MQQENIGLWIQLLNYEIVFKYIGSRPDIHIFVDSFKFVSNPRTSNQAVEAVSRRPHISRLIHKLCIHMKDRSFGGVEEVDEYQSDGSLKSQTSQNALNVIHTEESFATQVQRVPKTPIRNSKQNSSLPRDSSVCPNGLLMLLNSGSRLKRSQNGSDRGGSSLSLRGSNTNAQQMTAPADVNGESTGEKNTLQLGSQKTYIVGEDAQHSDRASLEPNTHPTFETPPIHSVTKTVLGSAPTTNVDRNQISTPTGRPKSRKIPMKEPEHAILPPAVEVIQHNRKDAHSAVESKASQSDPWRGMTKIRRRDVRISKDQDKLFTGSDNWVPPEPGKQLPICHVPTALLQQWNETASKSRSLSKSISIGNSLADLDPPLASPSSELQQESGSEEDIISWTGTSPERELPMPLVPADSSPCRRQQSQRRATIMVDQNDTTMTHTNTITNKTHPSKEIPGINYQELLRENDKAEIERGGSPEADSEMEFSLPHALGVTTQETISSQIEEPNSSTLDKVQVVETPVADIDIHRKRMAFTETSQDHCVSQPDSPLVANGFSPPWITNSYESNEQRNSYNHPLIMTRESPCHLIARSDENGLAKLVVDDIESTANGVLTNSPLFSPLFCELNSSPCAASVNSSHSDIAPTNGHLKTTHQRLESPSYASSTETRRKSDLSHYVAPNRKDINTTSDLKRPIDKIEEDAQSAHKRLKCEPLDGGLTTSQQAFTNLDIRLIYDKFQRDYPLYTGNFTHFTKMCSKLQAVRASGIMQRSFLWDDFIIRHLVDYPRYFQKCIVDADEPQLYVNYFIENVKKPVYKKRSLTVQGIEAAAVHSTSTVGASSRTSPSVVVTPTTSLARSSIDNKYSELYTNSSYQT